MEVGITRQFLLLMLLVLLFAGTTLCTSDLKKVGDTYTYSKDIGKVENVEIIQIHFKNVFRGADQNLASVDRIWQVSEVEPHIVIKNSYDYMTFTTGTPLVLGEGYEIKIRSLDIDGNKGVFDFFKDGELIGSAVFVMPESYSGAEDYANGAENYTYTMKGGDNENVEIIKVHFKNVFRGADLEVVTIDHVWQVSDSDPSRAVYISPDERVLTSDRLLELGEGYELAIKAINIDGNKAFIELFKDGWWVDSAVVMPSRNTSENYTYTMKVGDNKNVEIIKVHFKNVFRGADLDVVTIDHVWQVSDSDPSRAVYISPDERVLTSGRLLELGEGYELAIQGIDYDGNKAFIELFKDGKWVDSAVVMPSKSISKDSYYAYTKDVGKNENVEIIKVHFKNSFRGADQNDVTIDHVWQVSDCDPSRVIYISSDERIIISGSLLELVEGYELAIQAIDIDGNKAFIELFKDGKWVDSAVVMPSEEKIEGPELLTVNASNIMEIILRGEPVNFNGVIVEGDLDLQQIKDMGEERNSVKSPISITESEIRGSLNFRDTTFLEPVRFEGTNFGGDADFSEANFNKDANFAWTQFSGDTILKSAQFSGITTFERSKFENDVYFSYAQFSGDADFSWAQFKGNTYLWGTRFDDNVDFSYAQFDEDADFSGSILKDNVDFIETQFKGYSYFEDAQFSGQSYFNLAEFDKRVSFVNATFDNVSFLDTLFRVNANFENAAFFNNLDLTRTVYSRLLLPWKTIDHNQLSVSDDDAYLALMKNYVNLGWFEDSNNCYYEYRNNCRIDQTMYLEKITDTIEWLVYGYGVKPIFTFAWIILSILIFGLVFTNDKSFKKYIREEVKEVLEDKPTIDRKTFEIKTVLREEERINYLIDPLLFGLTTFTSGFASFLYPSIEYKAEKHPRIIILGRLFGSVLIAILITAISKTYLIR